MSILKVHIHNFKSYADERIDNINKHANLFVGRNGHGKSNLFAGKEFLVNLSSFLFIY